MKNYIYAIIFFIVFQGCKSQNVKSNSFIYHTTDYNLGFVQEERLYNSSTGIYEYKELADDKVVKNIKIFLKLDAKDLEDINQLYSLSKSEMSNCYLKDNVLIHKSTITFDSQKDNFNLLECNKNLNNSKYLEIEDKLVSIITSSDIYKTTFYWEFYKK